MEVHWREGSDTMSVDYMVEGIVPPDEDWKKMKKIWDACKEAGVRPPNEVYDYFDGNDPDELGQVVDIKQKECDRGYEVYLKDIPAKVKILRFAIF